MRLGQIRPDTPGPDYLEQGQAQDLSCRGATTLQEGLFRPYCLKDPVEYKFDRPSMQVWSYFVLITTIYSHTSFTSPYYHLLT